jgi:hypothetical protein
VQDNKEYRNVRKRRGKGGREKLNDWFITKNFPAIWVWRKITVIFSLAPCGPGWPLTPHTHTTTEKVVDREMTRLNLLPELAGKDVVVNFEVFVITSIASSWKSCYPHISLSRVPPRRPAENRTGDQQAGMPTTLLLPTSIVESAESRRIWEAAKDMPYSPACQELQATSVSEANALVLLSRSI